MSEVGKRPTSDVQRSTLKGRQSKTTPRLTPHLNVERWALNVERLPPSPLRLTFTPSLGKAFVPALRKHVRAAHALLAPPLGELSVALVNDRTMSDLHVRFMGVDGPTDVLTFPLDEDEAGNVTAGEVVVCVSEARRRARDEGHPAAAEVLLYAVHGLLHLCGYDDRTAADFRHMHRTEDDILARLGIGPVFDRAAARRRGTAR